MKTVLFGANQVAEKVVERYPGTYFAIDSFRSGMFAGHEILKPATVVELGTAERFIICSISSYDTMYNFLTMQGIEEEKIFCADQAGNVFATSLVQTFRKQPVLVSALPKSGSIWLNQCFKLARRDTKADHRGMLNPDFGAPLDLHPVNLKKLIQEGGVAVGQYSCTPLNQKMLEHYTHRGQLKLIVHIRDPRQAIISWVHHIDKYYKEDVFLRELLGYDKTYFSQSIEGKLHSQIEMQFKNYLDWLVSWKRYFAEITPGKALLTSHEHLAEQPSYFCKVIANFLGVNSDFLGVDNQPTENTHNFRQGKANLWQTELPPSLSQAMTQMMRHYDVLDFVETTIKTPIQSLNAIDSDLL